MPDEGVVGPYVADDDAASRVPRPVGRPNAAKVTRRDARRGHGDNGGPAETL